jgi:uncharacterized membrane protein/mono/diheme cytochrome c family protein
LQPPAFEKKLSGKLTLVINLLLTLFVVVGYMISSFGSLSIKESLQGISILAWGSIHPMVVHLPIGFIFLGLVIEILSFRNFHSAYRPVSQLLLFLLHLALFFSILFGSLLLLSGDYGESLIDQHIKGAMLSMLSSTGLFLLHRSAILSTAFKTIRYYRIVFAVTLISIIFTGHFGGMLTHGEDYLDGITGIGNNNPNSNINLTAVANIEGDLSPQQQTELSVQARAILAHNCYKCHGPEKVKGDLRLDAKQMILKGGENGPVIIPGKAAESELIKRVKLPAGHEDVMPSKGKHLTEEEIAILSLWIDKGAPWPDSATAASTFRVAPLAPRDPPLPAAIAGLSNPIDLWVNQYFKSQKIQWPAVADERIFLRRVYLDITGLLPTEAEQQKFLNDPSQDKISKLVDELLSHKDDYAMHWLTFWNDILRNDYTGTGYITGGRFGITDWLYKSLKDNKPYHQLVEELVNPDKNSRGFISGIKWRGAVNASQTVEMQAAQNVSQVFLGLNLKCASCHNSFINNWQLTDAYGMANIFADSSLEINRCDQPTGKYTRPKMLWEELGSIDSIGTRARKMAQLSKIITRPENGRLYRTIVNRVWKQMMGRGMVEPVDQMDNAPWSQDLLDWLANHFQQNGSDLKWLIRLIANSKTYHLISDGLKTPNTLFAQNYQFKGVLKKRMSAEQFADAASILVDTVFEMKELKYQPDQFAFYPQGTIPVRASLVANNPLLLSLGRPTRETVATTRESHANLLQALEMTNGERIHQTLVRGSKKWAQSKETNESLITSFYEKALGRTPNPKELGLAIKSLKEQGRENGLQDFFWAILLHPEFQIIN